MLSQNLPRYAVAAFSRSATRPFTISASGQLKIPSIGDINVSPAQNDSFVRKQHAFRESRMEAQKEQGARAWSANPSASEKLEQSSSTNIAGATAEAKQHESGLKSNRLSNLLYGTKEGREMEAQIEASFSQVLARGKYVHSIVFHEVKPEKIGEYVELVSHFYPKMANAPENKVHLVGSWRTEVGDCDTFVHIWEYHRYEGYHQSRYSITHHPEFADFDNNLKRLVTSKRVSLMQEFSFWPTSPPRQLGGIFELRSYTLQPGNLLEWEFHWRRGLEARRRVMEGVGAWFVQIGDLNVVHHLWQFANLEERRRCREESWSIEGWAETVHKTVPLIQDMKSRILIPMPWSPVA